MRSKQKPKRRVIKHENHLRNAVLKDERDNSDTFISEQLQKEAKGK